MAVTDAFRSIFTAIESDIAKKAFDDSLPLVGAAVENLVGAGLDLFGDLQAKIDQALGSVPVGPDGKPDAQALVDAINNAAIPLVSATNNGGKVEVTFGASDVTKIDLPDGAIDVGGSSIGLAASADFDATLTSQLALKVSYDPATDKIALVQAPGSELTFTLGVFADVAASADLGPIGFNIKDLVTGATPELSVTLGVDLTGDFGNLGVAVKTSGAAHLGLGLETETSTDILPKFYADLLLDWTISDDALGAPSIRFEHVGVDLGSLVDKIADAISPITDIFGRRPLKEVIDALTKPLPIIDDGLGLIPGAKAPFDKVPAGGDGTINFLDLAARYYELNGDTAGADRLQTFAKALVVIKQLTELSDKAGGIGRLDLGNFNFTEGSGAALDLGGLTPDNFVAKIKDAANKLLGDNNVFSGAVGAIAGVINDVTSTALKEGGLSGTSGLSVPLLDHPEDVIKIFLPDFFPADQRTVTLVEYDIPDLTYDFGFDYFFRLLGPIGISLTGQFAAGIDFAIGYDTTGLATGRFVDGLYIRTKALDDPSTPEIEGPSSIPYRQLGHPGLNRIGPDGEVLDHLPLAYLYGSVEAGIGLDAFVVRATINGGLIGDVNAFLPDGELRFTDLEAACIFDPIEGRFTANVNVKVKVGIGPFSVSKTFVLAETTLANFDYGCSAAVAASDLGLANDRTDGSHDIDLNVGTRALLFRHVDAAPQHGAPFESNETFRIRNAVDQNGVALVGALGVSAFGFEEVHGSAGAPVHVIQADFNSGDDTLFIDAAVTQAANADGGSGVDFLSGGRGDDTLRGGADEDILRGGDGNDRLYGDDGDDLLEGGAGADLIVGGLGIDQVSYEHSSAGVRFDLSASATSIIFLESGAVGHGGEAEGDTLVGIEYLIGSNFDDVLRANFLQGSTLEGGGGNDALFGGAGDDFLVGGVGADLMSGGGGFDGTTYFGSLGGVTVDLQAGRGFRGEAQGDTLVSIEAVGGSGADDELYGDGFGNLLDGWFGDDIIEGRGGADTIVGGDGDDTVRGGNDGDVLDGGAGTDLLSYAHLSGPVTINLRAGTGSADRIGSAAFTLGGLTVVTGFGDYSSFENLDGSQGSDTLTGDFNYNVIRGLLGNDTIDGEGGNDTLIGGPGADSLVGGDGFDWADYSTSPAGVTVSLATGIGSGPGSDAAGDRLSGIENLRGSVFDDNLVGDAGDNEIDPGLSQSRNSLSATLGPGLDTVAGGDGTDTLVIDWSRDDTGRGMVGGFSNAAGAGSGTFARQNAAGTGYIDAVYFTGIEKFRITGTYKADSIVAGDGDDYIATGGGNDTVWSGRGADHIKVDEGNDDVRFGTDVNGNLLAADGTFYQDLGGLGDRVFSIDGGRGTDTLSLSLAGAYYDVRIAGGLPGSEFNGVNFSSGVSGSSISNFELIGAVYTGYGNDSITQLGVVNNDFRSGEGQDTITPGLGKDTVNGGKDFQSGVDYKLVFGEGVSYVVDQEHEAAFLANKGDLLRIDYSSYTGSGGVTSQVNLQDSTSENIYRSSFNGKVGQERYIDLLTNSGTYKVADNSSSVAFAEIERVDVTGSAHDDTLIGTDNIYGRTSIDGSGTLDLDRGGDVLRGLGGNDKLYGYGGDDTLFGGDGNDVLYGARPYERSGSSDDPYEIDLLSGGAGADQFILGGRDYVSYDDSGNFASYQTDGRAILTDFKPAEGDVIQLHGAATDYDFVQNGSSVLIYYKYKFSPSAAPAIYLIGEIQNFASTSTTASYLHYVNQNTPAGQALGIAITSEDDPGVSLVAAPDAADEALSFSTLAAPAAPDPVQASWVTQSNDPDTLLGALFAGGGGGGINLATDKLTLNGDGRAFGTFSGDPFGLGSGIVLSTGQVEDLVGPNTISGGAVPEKKVTLTFQKVGVYNKASDGSGGSTLYRADLTGLGVDLNSLTLTDSNSKSGGSPGKFSGFDLDAIALSTTKITSITNDPAVLNGSGLPKLDVFDFSAAGTKITSGTERPGNYQARELNGVVNDLVDGIATLGTFDATGLTGSVGHRVTLGDKGSISFNFTRTVETDGPLYLYVAESGSSDDEQLVSSNVAVSNRRVEAGSDLSTDLGLPGVDGDKVSLTYEFDTLPGANVDSVMFDFALFSEELPEFGGSEFNDRFKVKLNGVNLALLSDGSEATVNNLQASVFGPYSSDLVLNPVGTGPAASETRADAYTKILSFAGALSPTGHNVLTIEVADVRDGLLDSGILIKGGTFRAGNASSGGGSVAAAALSEDGGPPLIQEGDPPILVPVTIDLGPSGGALTSPVTLTLTPGEDLDLGSGAGAPVTVTVAPGDPLTLQVAVSAVADGIAESAEFALVAVAVSSADPRFDGLAIPPIVVEIAASGGKPVLSLLHDTGVSATDHLTNDAALSVFAAAEAALTFSLDGGDFASGLPTLARDGSADGVHTIVARATGPGDVVAVSDAFTFTLDTIGPAVSVDGASRSTNLVHHGLEGTTGPEEFGGRLAVWDGNALLGTTQVGSDGHWSVPFAFEGDGPMRAYHFVAAGLVPDQAGNYGTDAFDYGIDTTPNRPLFGDVVDDADSLPGQVYSVYDAILGHGPDAYGWETALPPLEHGKSLENLARDVLSSPEYRARFGSYDQGSDDSFVEHLYDTALHRHSEPAGLAFWTGALANGATRAQVALGFAFSDENQGPIDTLFSSGIFVPDAVDSEIARLYHGLLDREPDAEGMAFWVDAAEHGASIKDIAQGFLTSSEYASNHPGTQSDVEFVASLYETMLDRRGETAGVQFWTQSLAHGATRADVAAGFASGPEATAHLEGRIESGWHLY